MLLGLFVLQGEQTIQTWQICLKPNDMDLEVSMPAFFGALRLFGSVDNFNTLCSLPPAFCHRPMWQELPLLKH